MIKAWVSLTCETLCNRGMFPVFISRNVWRWRWSLSFFRLMPWLQHSLNFDAQKILWSSMRFQSVNSFVDETYPECHHVNYRIKHCKQFIVINNVILIAIQVLSQQEFEVSSSAIFNCTLVSVSCVWMGWERSSSMATREIIALVWAINNLSSTSCLLLYKFPIPSWLS